MIYVGKETRLTDELERQLLAQAIEEQFRFKPVVALKNLFAKLFQAAPRTTTTVHSTVKHA
ncbi:hypothetical protein H0A71_14395 [Alcaligenaceae bacterium]|nr:hypothetical protein [Alcaligenaceae bacterium]